MAFPGVIRTEMYHTPMQENEGQTSPDRDESTEIEDLTDQEFCDLCDYVKRLKLEAEKDGQVQLVVSSRLVAHRSVLYKALSKEQSTVFT